MAFRVSFRTTTPICGATWDWDWDWDTPAEHEGDAARRLGGNARSLWTSFVGHWDTPDQGGVKSIRWCWRATATVSVRVFVPSFARILCRWNFTVATVI